MGVGVAHSLATSLSALSSALAHRGSQVKPAPSALRQRPKSGSLHTLRTDEPKEEPRKDGKKDEYFGGDSTVFLPKPKDEPKDE